jgi:hypothetical protein
MVKITTFNDRPVRHVRYIPDGTVILKLYERRPNRRARHLRVSLARWLAGRGIYLLESHATQRVSRNAPHPLRWRFSRVSSRPRPSRPFPGLRRLASDAGQRLWMSITGSSSIRRLKDCPVVMDLHELAPVGGRATSGAFDSDSHHSSPPRRDRRPHAHRSQPRAACRCSRSPAP